MEKVEGMSRQRAVLRWGLFRSVRDMFVPGMLLPKSTFEARVSGFKFGEKLLVKGFGLNVVRLHCLSVVLR